MKLRDAKLWLAVALLLPTFAAAQAGRRDPLNEQEIDQLRESAQEPQKRIKFYLTFARARLAAIEQLRGDPKLAADRGARIHDLLEDFRQIIDEMDDYIDDSSSRYDMRKPLKEAVEQETDFLLKLRTLKDSAESDPKAQGEARQYGFAIQDAIEAASLSADDARKTLDEQNEAYKEKKKK